MSPHEIDILLTAGLLGFVAASIAWWIWAQAVLQHAVISVLVADKAAGRWTPSTIIGEISGLAYGTIRELERAGVVEVAISPGGLERGGRDRYAYRLKLKTKDLRPS